MEVIRRFLPFLIFFQSIILRTHCQVAVTCSCDLTGNACDANCCCDPDCSQASIAIFECSTATYNEDSKLCVNELVYVNNAPSSVQQSTTGVFCITTQRDTSWNFYIDPQYTITTSAAFDSLQQEYGSYSYDVAYATTTTSTTYQSGDTIDIRYTSNNLTSTLGLPAAGPTGNCLDYNPASYLTDRTSSCARRISDLSTACATGSVLDPDTYFNIFEVATSPVNTSDSTASTYITMTTCDGSTPAAIAYVSTTCQNVPTSISYTVRYDGNGITSGCVSFLTVSDITGPSAELLQTFSIVFIESTTVVNSTEARSGNPGYVTGYPLRSGIMGTDAITLDSSLFTLLSSNTDGSCPTTVSTSQIKFKEDSRTGCTISFNSSQDCTELDTTVRSILNIPSATARVASYGNTNTTDSSWVQVVVNSNTNAVSGNSTSSPCQNVVVGIDYAVLYANTGSLSNPQPQVVSIQYSLVTKSVQFECIGNDCSTAGATQSLEISSSVTFTDVSSLPEPVLRVRPTIDARLAADFFYPFTVV